MKYNNSLKIKVASLFLVSLIVFRLGAESIYSISIGTFSLQQLISEELFYKIDSMVSVSTALGSIVLIFLLMITRNVN